MQFCDVPLKESINEIHRIKNECMNECLRHPSSKYKSAIGCHCQTDGKLKPNEYIKIKNSYGYKIVYGAVHYKQRFVVAKRK